MNRIEQNDILGSPWGKKEEDKNEKTDARSSFNGHCRSKNDKIFSTDNDVSSPIVTCLGMVYTVMQEVVSITFTDAFKSGFNT